jgi:putative inorganic carbon (HCO3(-)) transporter
MQQRLAGLVHWELLLLFLASPLLLFPKGTVGVGMLVVPVLWGIRRIVTGRFVVPTPLDIPILFLLAMTGVGQWVSSDPAFSLAKSAGVVLGVGTYYAVVATSESKSAWGMALLLFVGMNLGVAGISLFATAWGSKFPIFEPLLAQLPQLIQALPGSPPEGFNPNGVAGIFLFGVPLLLILTCAKRDSLYTIWGRFALPVRVGIAFATLFILLLFVATQSRAGYISLALAVVLLFLLPRPRWLGIAMGAGVLTLLLFWLSPYRAPLLARLTASPNSEGALSTLSGRFALWERAIVAIQDFPFTGVGLGMFRFVQPRLYPVTNIPFQADIGHAHNQFLQAGLDVGIPGLLAYAVIWGGAIKLGMEVLWQRRTSILQPLMLGLLAGWVGHFIWATIETHALGSKGGWFWWWTLALIVGIALHTRSVHE